MNYTILVYESADELAARSDDRRKAAYWGAYRAYTKALTDAGVMVGGAGLQPPPTATTIRQRDGKRHVQDGPYAEAKEQLGGYYVIDVPDLDTALDWASRCPSAGRVAPTIGARVAHAAALSETRGRARGLAALDAIPPDAVTSYQPYWALRGHLLDRLGRAATARQAYERAIGLSEDLALRAFLAQRIAALMEG